jgi:putative transposase
MPPRLVRRQNTGHLHLITFSCHNRQPLLASDQAKQTLQQIIEQTRQTHNFHLYAYVLMPEHVHLLLTEPPLIPLSQSLQVIKTQSARLLKGTLPRLWRPRYHDFNVHTSAKRIEKARNIHRNPVTRGLVQDPALYPWSSFQAYATKIPHAIKITLPT